MADLGSQKRHKRINLTDPEARLMKGRQGIVAGYNAPGYGLTHGDRWRSGRHVGHSRGRG